MGKEQEVWYKPEVFFRDLMASVVVFLVALPLCMGIAVASGVPPALGLIAGIIGGIVVGALAGSPLQASGPAAGLAVIVFDLVNRFGLKALGVIVLLAGAIQIAAGVLKVGRWFRAVSPAVIHGMLAGIGVLIFASQFHVMVDGAPRKNGILNLISIPESIYRGIFPLDGSKHHIAAVIGVLTIILLLLWNAFRPKVLKFIPGALVAIVMASGIAFLMKLDIKYVQVPGNLLQAFNVPPMGSWAGLLRADILIAAVAMALIASAETLLCATAVDQMHTGPRTRYDKELIAQGVGNVLSGAVGALPITGVIVRSSANVEAGAKTRVSAVLHGFWLLVLVALIPGALRLIPTSALAAILVYTGYKLVNVKAIKHLWQTSRSKSELSIYAATVVMIVATDLLTGVIIGICLSLVKLLKAFAHLTIRTQMRENGKEIDVYLEGTATFVRLPYLAEQLEKLPRDKIVHIHPAELGYIDHACLELIAEMKQQFKNFGGEIIVEWSDLWDRFKLNPHYAPPKHPANGHIASPTENNKPTETSTPTAPPSTNPT